MRALEPGLGRADFNKANAAIAQELKSGHGRQEVYYISDFQRASWADVDLAIVPESARLFFVNVAPKERANHAIIGARIDPREAGAVQVQSRQLRAPPWTGEVEVIIDGKRSSKADATLAAVVGGQSERADPARRAGLAHDRGADRRGRPAAGRPLFPFEPVRGERGSAHRDRRRRRQVAERRLLLEQGAEPVRQPRRLAPAEADQLRVAHRAAPRDGEEGLPDHARQTDAGDLRARSRNSRRTAAASSISPTANSTRKTCASSTSRRAAISRRSSSRRSRRPRISRAARSRS